jgi:LmbE family N-acetylglucosaminyl deacetylase
MDSAEGFGFYGDEQPRISLSRARLLSRRSFLVGAALGVGALVSACTSSGSVEGAAEDLASGKGTRSLIVVAHADDNLLFMGPAENKLIDRGGAVQLVYLTTGDAGLGANYWTKREDGARAALAYMTGARNVWRGKPLEVKGRSLTVHALVDAPKVTVIFLRLPDGAVNGRGYLDTGYESLRKLWTREIPFITSAGGDTYTTDELTQTLSDIARLYRPTTILTQDLVGSYEDGDHSDHITTGYLMAKAASGGLFTSCTILGYEGYPVHERPPNVSGFLLREKENAFLVYSQYDPHGCYPLRECFAPGLFADTYGSWLKREYLVAKILPGRSTPSPVGRGPVTPAGSSTSAQVDV